MCGIAGLIGVGATSRWEVVRRMSDAMRHRGPDGDGLYKAASGHCVLGHTRLSILDLTEAAAQPISTSDGRFHLSYNGEIYNFAALRRELENVGVRVTSTGDTEVLLGVLAVWGVQGLSRLNGMFALALWDERERTLLLARDRFGQKPLYWARTSQAIIFASEVRALLASGEITRKIDHDGLIGFLSYGAVQEPATIVQGVQALPRGCYLVLNSVGKGDIQQIVTTNHKPNSGCASDLRELMTEAVARHLVSDVPVGCFLSGGIDSSAIVAAAASGKAANLHTISVVFPDAPDYSEQPFTRIITEKYHTRHSEIPISNTALRAFAEKAILAMDQPTGDAVNTLIVSHAAAQAGLKVALTGIGGDELFGGYPSFSSLARMTKYQNLFRPAAFFLTRSFNTMQLWDRVRAKLKDYYAAPSCLINAYLSRRKSFTSHQINMLCGKPEFSRWITGLPNETSLALEARIRDLAMPDAIAIMELELYMGNMLLRDIDAMGMSQSLEIRAPFLDTEFSRAVLNLDPSTRIPRKQSKWKLIEILGDWLPPSITQRPKQGFVLPFEQWISGGWRDDIESGINALPEIVPLDPSAIKGLWTAFLKAPAKIGWFRIWQLFVLNQYLRRHQIAA